MKKWFKNTKGDDHPFRGCGGSHRRSGDPSENIAKGEGINSENAGKAKHHTII